MFRFYIQPGHRRGSDIHRRRGSIITSTTVVAAVWRYGPGGGGHFPATDFGQLNLSGYVQVAKPCGVLISTESNWVFNFFDWPRVLELGLS